MNMEKETKKFGAGTSIHNNNGATTTKKKKREAMEGTRSGMVQRYEERRCSWRGDFYYLIAGLRENNQMKPMIGFLTLLVVW